MVNPRFRFRAWDIENRSMIYNIEGTYDGSTSNGEYVPEDYFGSYIGAKTRYRDPNGNAYKVMQCIGIKDKNGKLIFEDDIVKGNKGEGFVSDVLGVVKYSGMVFAFEGKKVIPDVDGSTEWYYLITNPNIFNDYHIEVIGNIYENEELLL